jgi:dolichol kinase
MQLLLYQDLLPSLFFFFFRDLTTHTTEDKEQHHTHTAFLYIFLFLLVGWLVPTTGQRQPPLHLLLGQDVGVGHLEALLVLRTRNQ